jgi:hypothetical protein
MCFIITVSVQLKGRMESSVIKDNESITLSLYLAKFVRSSGDLGTVLKLGEQEAGLGTMSSKLG